MANDIMIITSPRYYIAGPMLLPLGNSFFVRVTNVLTYYLVNVLTNLPFHWLDAQKIYMHFDVVCKSVHRSLKFVSSVKRFVKYRIDRLRRVCLVTTLSNLMNCSSTLS